MICDQGFEHPDPEPVVIEEAPDLEPVAEAEVRIAEIEADRDIAVAKIENRAADEELLAALAALTAENEALRAQLAPPEPEPEEVAVVVAQADAQADAPAEMEPPVTEPTTTDEPAARKRKNVWFG